MDTFSNQESDTHFCFSVMALRLEPCLKQKMNQVDLFELLQYKVVGRSGYIDTAHASHLHKKNPTKQLPKIKDFRKDIDKNETLDSIFEKIKQHISRFEYAKLSPALIELTNQLECNHSSDINYPIYISENITFTLQDLLTLKKSLQTNDFSNGLSLDDSLTTLFTYLWLYSVMHIDNVPRTNTSPLVTHRSILILLGAIGFVYALSNNISTTLMSVLSLIPPEEIESALLSLFEVASII